MRNLIYTLALLMGLMGLAPQAEAQTLPVNCDTRLECIGLFQQIDIFAFLNPTPRAQMNFNELRGFLTERSLSSARLTVFKDGTFVGFVATDRALPQGIKLRQLLFNGVADDPPGDVGFVDTELDNTVLFRGRRYNQFGLSNEVPRTANCVFNGGFIPNGGAVDAFPSSTVPVCERCYSERRFCVNGVLSGSNQFSSCAPRRLRPGEQCP